MHMSKDGYLVIIHDDDVERTTYCKGLVSDMTLSPLKLLDVDVSSRKIGNGSRFLQLEFFYRLSFYNRRLKLSMRTVFMTG
jgi:glycerophosphoryl diester phosphodiesterase